MNDSYLYVMLAIYLLTAVAVLAKYKRYRIERKAHRVILDIPMLCVSECLDALEWAHKNKGLMPESLYSDTVAILKDRVALLEQIYKIDGAL